MTSSRPTITVIGGGIGGLTAAIACAEAGAPVVLYEAHQTLGGRGRATPAPYIAHEGAHVFYADSDHYRWLRSHGFVRDLGWPSPAGVERFRFRVDGRLRRVPPAGVLRALAHPRLRAPIDEDFHSWAATRWTEATARQLASMIGVVTYEADTGRLSAAFVWRLIQRVFGPRFPGVRWVRGGWLRWAGWPRTPPSSAYGSRPVGGSTRCPSTGR
jgi:phytoene dehydrogenase-like protein